MNFKEICRTCLLPNDTMFPIFTANVRLVDSGTETAKIVDLLKMFTKLSLVRSEALPEKICSSCLDDTMRTYNFRIKCERSETTWKHSKKENDKVCRTCLDSSESMFTLYNQIVFTIGNESASVIDLIKNFTNILISLDDEFPKWICKNCIDEMKISYALKVKCENSERTLDAYLKELAAKMTVTANGNQIVALNEMDISQLEFICMKEEGGSMENNENFIKTEDCTNESILSNDIHAKANGPQQQQQQQEQQLQHHQQVQQQHHHHHQQQQHQQQHHHHHQQQQQQQQHQQHHHHQHQQILSVAEPNLNATGNSSGQTHQKVVKLDLLKLYPNSLLDQNFAIEEVIEDNMNHMSGATYEQGIMDPNNIQLEANQEEIIEENMNDSSLLIEDCEIEEVVENDQDNSDQFDGSAIDLDDSRGDDLDNDGIEEAYKCPGCSTMFLYNQTLRKHIYENHTNKELCMICNKVVYHNMWVHVMNHLPKNHHCPECGKGFISRSYVRSHLNNVHHNLRLSTATKRSQCPECTKTFDKKTDLHNHMLEHTNSYTRCDCKSSTTVNNSSAGCGGSNTGGPNKPSTVMTTSTSTSTPTVIAASTVTAAPATIIATVTTAPKPQKKKACIQPKTNFSCAECNRDFPTQLALDTHAATKHSDEKNFKCTLCSSTFRLKGYLSKHVKNVHKKKCVNDFMEILGKS